MIRTNQTPDIPLPEGYKWRTISVRKTEADQWWGIVGAEGYVVWFYLRADGWKVLTYADGSGGRGQSSVIARLPLNQTMNDVAQYAVTLLLLGEVY